MPVKDFLKGMIFGGEISSSFSGAQLFMRFVILLMVLMVIGKIFVNL